METDVRDRPHFVYRAFDDLGRLLYVGCTFNVDRRMTSHRSASAWFPLKHELRVSDAMPFDEARAAETTGIQSEKPLYNTEEPHRGATVSMWKRIQWAATRLASHDGWRLTDCHTIGDATAEGLFHRPRPGEPFHMHDYYEAVSEHGAFMVDQLPATREGLWRLLASGWEPPPEFGSRPRWEILPRRHIPDWARNFGDSLARARNAD